GAVLLSATLFPVGAHCLNGLHLNPTATRFLTRQQAQIRRNPPGRVDFWGMASLGIAYLAR
ncbi:hypothetical protein, partial [Parachitinimonas caeni]